MGSTSTQDTMWIGLGRYASSNAPWANESFQREAGLPVLPDTYQQSEVMQEHECWLSLSLAYRANVVGFTKASRLRFGLFSTEETTVLNAREQRQGQLATTPQGLAAAVKVSSPTPAASSPMRVSNNFCG